MDIWEELAQEAARMAAGPPEGDVWDQIAQEAAARPGRPPEPPVGYQGVEVPVFGKTKLGISYLRGHQTVVKGDWRRFWDDQEDLKRSLASQDAKRQEDLKEQVEGSKVRVRVECSSCKGQGCDQCDHEGLRRFTFRRARMGDGTQVTLTWRKTKVRTKQAGREDLPVTPARRARISVKSPMSDGDWSGSLAEFRSAYGPAFVERALKALELEG
jgi:hypothetical protein